MADNNTNPVEYLDPDTGLPMDGSIAPPEPSDASTDSNIPYVAGDPIRNLDDILKTLGIELDPATYLEIGKERAKQKSNDQSTAGQIVGDIISGKAQDKIQAQIDNNNHLMNGLIESLTPPTIPTEAAIKRDIDIKIAQYQRNLDDGSFANIPNPMTGKNYTRDEYKKYVDDYRSSAYIEAGTAKDPFETIGTALLQLMDRRNADKYMSIPDRLKEERFKIYKDNYMKNIDFQNQKVIMKMQQLGKQTEWLQDAWKVEASFRNQNLLNVYDNEQQMGRLKFQIDNQNWQLAIKESGDILNNINKLQPEQMESALNRYNVMAAFANNHSNGEVSMKVFTPQEVKNMTDKAWTRERERVIGTVLDWVWKYRNKWENVTPEDRKQLESFLKTYGNFYNPNTDKFEPLTLANIAFAASGFNRLTPNTNIKIEANRLREITINNVDRHNREMEKFAGTNATANLIRANAYALDVENDFNIAKTKIANGEDVTGKDFKSLTSVRNSITDLVKKRAVVENALKSGSLTTLLHDSDGPGWKKGDSWNAKDAAEFLKISNNSIVGLSKLMLETFSNYAIPILRARAESVGQVFDNNKFLNANYFSKMLQEAGIDSHTANKYSKEFYDDYMKSLATAPGAGSVMGAGGGKGGK